MVRTFSTALTLSFALAACSSSTPNSTAGTGSGTGSTNGSGAGTSSGGLSTATACQDYASALCGLYQTCSAGWYIGANFGNLATCTTRQALDCVNRLSLANNANNAAQTEACAQARATESCQDLYGNVDSSACMAPAGTLSNNTPCQASGQCQSAYCAIGGNSLCGTCQPVPAVGSDCSVYSCGTGNRCLSTATICGPAVGDGGACGADGDCLFGLVCLRAGWCGPTVDGGQPCDPTGKIGPGCNDDLGLVCVKQADGGQCQQKALAAGGEPCGSLTAGAPATNCSGRGLCQKSPPDGGTGICLAAVADGTACNVDAGPLCELAAKCVTDGGPAGICVEPSTGICTGGGTGTTTGTVGGTTGGTSGTSSGGNGGAGGSWSVTGSLTASAVLANFSTTLAVQETAGGNANELSIAAVNGDATSSANFSSPSDITSYVFTAGIDFTQTPAAGLVVTNANSCGSVAFSYGTTSQPFLYNFEASEMGSDCIESGANTGSYTLTLSSVGSDNVAHGTLNASIPDGTGDTGALQLTF